MVAVADCDEGAANERRSLDAGRKILDNLKENEELGWVFTDEAEALEGVKAGRYYAAIVIPEDSAGSSLRSRREKSVRQRSGTM